MTAPRWLTTAELADRFRTTPAAVRHWRMDGYGPPSVRVGRRVLYDVTAVEKWEATLRGDDLAARRRYAR